MNICIQMPFVPWSSVEGPRSRGYDREKLKDAEMVHEQLTALLSLMKFEGCFVLILENGNEIKRTEII